MVNDWLSPAFTLIVPFGAMEPFAPALAVIEYVSDVHREIRGDPVVAGR